MMFCELFETEKHPLHLLRICYEKGIANARRVLYTFRNSFAKTSKLCQSMSHTIEARPPSSYVYTSNSSKDAFKCVPFGFKNFRVKV